MHQVARHWHPQQVMTACRSMPQTAPAAQGKKRAAPKKKEAGGKASPAKKAKAGGK